MNTNTTIFVIPAKAGIHLLTFRNRTAWEMDSRLPFGQFILSRRHTGQPKGGNDEDGDFMAQP